MKKMSLIVACLLFSINYASAGQTEHQSPKAEFETQEKSEQRTREEVKTIQEEVLRQQAYSDFLQSNKEKLNIDDLPQNFKELEWSTTSGVADEFSDSEMTSYIYDNQNRSCELTLIVYHEVGPKYCPPIIPCFGSGKPNPKGRGAGRNTSGRIAVLTGVCKSNDNNTHQTTILSRGYSDKQRVIEKYNFETVLEYKNKYK